MRIVGAQNNAGMFFASYYKFYPEAFSFGGEYTQYLYTPEKDLSQGNISFIIQIQAKQNRVFASVTAKTCRASFPNERGKPNE